MNNIPCLNSAMPKLSRIGLLCNGYAVFSKPSNPCLRIAGKKHGTFRDDPVADYVFAIKQSNTRNAFDHAQFTNKQMTMKHDLKMVSFLWPCSRTHIVKVCLRLDQLHGRSHIHTKTARAPHNFTNAKLSSVEPRANDSHKKMQKKKKESCYCYKKQHENKSHNNASIQNFPHFVSKRAYTQYRNFTCYAAKKLRFTKEGADGIELSDQQKYVLRAVSSGKSVFITGAAGTGKTYLLKHIIEDLKKIYGKQHVFVTASTGLAASAMQGTSLHSFAGIGLGLGDLESLVSEVELSKPTKYRWKKAKVLVIDEISMICGDLFDKLNCIAKRIRYPKTGSREFGGLQLVVTGDFCQLPPVNPLNIEKYFAFQADCWDKCFDLQIELTEIFRQCEDLEFMKMLNQIRMGVCSPESISMLQACQGMPIDDGITPTKLYPYKINVEEENEQMLKELGKELITFRAEDSGSEKAVSRLDNTRALKEISLCIGAQVMLIHNINIFKGLVNGRKGVVVGFKADTIGSKGNQNNISSRSVWPVVKFQGLLRVVTVKPQRYEFYYFDTKGNPKVAARRLQIPLILAWAFSVHKCQGMTLDRIETDLTNVFDYGMVYVALSRLKKLDGLRLIGFNPSKVKAHPDVIDFYERLSKC